MRRGYIYEALSALNAAKRKRRKAMFAKVLASAAYKRKVAKAKARYSKRSIFSKWRAFARGRRNFRSLVVHRFRPN